jgi:hypothetical protein
MNLLSIKINIFRDFDIINFLGLDFNDYRVEILRMQTDSFLRENMAIKMTNFGNQDSFSYDRTL